MKIIPPYLSFRGALSRGYVERMESRSYMDYVKTLRCVSCRAPADDPHHPHGAGFKGMGTKVPDYWVIPICRPCHDELHRDVQAWEDVNGSQFEHALMTLTQAVREGRMKFVQT